LDEAGLEEAGALLVLELMLGLELLLKIELVLDFGVLELLTCELLDFGLLLELVPEGVCTPFVTCLSEGNSSPGTANAVSEKMEHANTNVSVKIKYRITFLLFVFIFIL
jgi:hypothetical protein